MTGNRSDDAAAIAEAARGGADVVLDALGAVPDATPTMAGYDSLRNGGTMVLIGEYGRTSRFRTAMSCDGVSPFAGRGCPVPRRR